MAHSHPRRRLCVQSEALHAGAERENLAAVQSVDGSQNLGWLDSSVGRNLCHNAQAITLTDEGNLDGVSPNVDSLPLVLANTLNDK